jgi:hypothetical protein
MKTPLRCTQCMHEEQLRMFENAAKRFYNGQQPMADCQPMAPPPPPRPMMRASSEPGTRAEREVARILRLPASAAAVQVLELPAAHSAEEARRRFHRLARLIHPDKCQLPRAEEAFKRVVSSYDKY